MNEPLLEFQWEVAPGYAWADWLAATGEAVVLAPDDLQSRAAVELAAERLGDTGPVLGPIRHAGQQTKRYRPMQRENATLCRTFASLDYADKDAIRAFASRYGLLGLRPQVQVVPARDGRPEHYAEGESHFAWAREISAMQEALRLWEHRSNATDDDRSKLSWLFNSHLQRVQYRIKFDPVAPPRFSIAPFTLLDAMWLQLAMGIVGDTQIVKCKFCQRLMEISTAETGFRTHRKFCSDSCKTKDYRKRKRTALQLAAKGLSVSSIAKRTDTKSATVRGWLAASKKLRNLPKGAK